MMIIPKRIETGLARSGFKLAYFETASLELVFFRREVSELFERISIGQGRQRGRQWGHIAHVSVECTLVPGRTAVKGIAECRCLVELATEGERYWRRLDTAEDARRWEDAIIEVAPRRAREFVDEVGPSLLEKTTVQRTAVKRYAELVGFDHEPSKLVETLSGRVTPRQRDEVARIMKTPIILIPSGRIYYELAALMIASCANDVHGDPEWFFGVDPPMSSDRSLMIELQLLASRFAHEIGWDDHDCASPETVV